MHIYIIIYIIINVYIYTYPKLGTPKNPSQSQGLSQGFAFLFLGRGDLADSSAELAVNCTVCGVFRAISIEISIEIHQRIS